MEPVFLTNPALLPKLRRCWECEAAYDPADPRAAFLLERARDIADAQRPLCPVCARRYERQGYLRRRVDETRFMARPEYGEALLCAAGDYVALRAARRYVLLIGAISGLWFGLAGIAALLGFI
jgi:hypothetical protein